MSLKPNLSGVLPGVLDAHRFNLHREVSILGCAALCEILEREEVLFSAKIRPFFFPRAGDETRFAVTRGDGFKSIADENEPQCRKT